MLKKIIIAILFFLSVSISLGTNIIEEGIENVLQNENNQVESTEGNCETLQDNFQIEGPETIKINHSETFKIGEEKNILWTVYRNGESVLENKGKIFSYSFELPGEVTLQANFQYQGCDVTLTKNLYIYKNIVISLVNKDVSFVSALGLKSKNIFYKNYTIEELEEDSSILEIDDYFIVGQDNIIKFLISLGDKKNLYYDKKFIFLVGSFKGFFSKLIIPYVKGLNTDNIYIYNSDNFFDLFDKIYQDQTLNKKNLLSASNISDKIYFPISYFVNKLIEYGLDIQIIGTILLIVFGTLCVAFFRQVIGFSVFGVYTPLLFSILLITLGYKISLILFSISVLASLLTNLLIKRIYILSSSKIALTYVLYVIFSIIIVGFLVNYFGVNLSFMNSTTILGFFVMPLLTKNLIKENTKLFSKTFILFILEFAFVSFVLILILKFDLLKYILVAYPDILWTFIIIAIMIGRFTGLQVLEYIRFAPLIKKHFYEEEE